MSITKHFAQLGLLDRFISAVSFEFLMFTKRRRANGGGVILARAFLSALVLYLIAIGVYDYTAPASEFKFSAANLFLNVHGTLSWFGAIFAAMYAGLYARFASQWSYLANLYNQIKAAEVRAIATLVEKNLKGNSAKEVMLKLGEWKAGYIEDAENLHLATKASVAPVIWFWLQEPIVKAAYVHATPGGMPRWRSLIEAVEDVTERKGGITEYRKSHSCSQTRIEPRKRNKTRRGLRATSGTAIRLRSTGNRFVQ